MGEGRGLESLLFDPLEVLNYLRDKIARQLKSHGASP